MSAMARTDSLSIRLTAAERDAIQRAAAADERLPSTLVRKLLLDWLRENNWMVGVDPDVRRRPPRARRVAGVSSSP